ncbi:MAG: 30S ribosomal protein S9 [Nanoarchaeota archaeon]|jgi:small subunit ribosomal protein S9|nr:30S ribosomal protein S9 [Nanoarchaeota archaeon]
MVGIETRYKKVYASGKRKSAIARAVVQNGNGNVTFNQRAILTLPMFEKLKLEEPIRIAEVVLGKIDFDATVTVKGGGTQCQIDAGRLAIAKALITYTQSDELREAFLTYDRNLLVADDRRKEAYKPGDSKARASRQTSYR